MGGANDRRSMHGGQSHEETFSALPDLASWVVIKAGVQSKQFHKNGVR